MTSSKENLRIGTRTLVKKKRDALYSDITLDYYCYSAYGFVSL